MINSLRNSIFAYGIENDNWLAKRIRSINNLPIINQTDGSSYTFAYENTSLNKIGVVHYWYAEDVQNASQSLSKYIANHMDRDTYRREYTRLLELESRINTPRMLQTFYKGLSEYRGSLGKYINNIEVNIICYNARMLYTVFWIKPSDLFKSRIHKLLSSNTAGKESPIFDSNGRFNSIRITPGSTIVHRSIKKEVEELVELFSKHIRKNIHSNYLCEKIPHYVVHYSIPDMGPPEFSNAQFFIDLKPIGVDCFDYVTITNEFFFSKSYQHLPCKSNNYAMITYQDASTSDLNMSRQRFINLTIMDSILTDLERAIEELEHRLHYSFLRTRLLALMNIFQRSKLIQYAKMDYYLSLIKTEIVKPKKQIPMNYRMDIISYDRGRELGDYKDQYHKRNNNRTSLITKRSRTIRHAMKVVSSNDSRLVSVTLQIIAILLTIIVIIITA